MVPRLLSLLLLLSLATSSLTVVATNNYEVYIDRFCHLAVEHQEEFGIPASITLAQGLLESAAGKSTLATKGNNHFGIKCHKEWKGKSMKRSDDSPNECFRSYNTPEESFLDHSRFLRRTRYQKLFDLDITDYSGWARGLRECGYATDPNYAARLITIIERYSLYIYDTQEGRSQEETVAFIRDMLVNTHPVRRTRGLHYVVATPGDTYASIAKEFNLKEKKLMKYNDAHKDHEIKAWEEVYLEEKLETAPDGVTTVTIGEDECIHSIAQRYGMKVKVIKNLNHKASDTPGTVLNLR
ncbi:glucosaminidase domain-containing protein [Lepagella muris]|jgi:LysM repeat protein|uniref:LysM peptidoglycan-binding domain-containing protein n=1 Tax=Lepagella muris TaxID=3032870 RepID=A0AC61RGJ7_9BACT|nr:glucosaminidase domain-containing protein [Lepagella muris]ROT08837.1 LysM peptidoglycan-binding domain-containing protein [Muribaculaceae bacterium Isolate-037 (Harlan)]TGY80025.1 LysM peptidoglycan-binding domain-containing protein [Lepagella muris]THG53263.1 LysM peptidoglycan-binding domain-containing protein [Bacteroidales bacterium]TKC64851.1 LysM peptidoglycan-binding domain-containing protein [Bacteroidales bacterium]